MAVAVAQQRHVQKMNFDLSDEHMKSTFVNMQELRHDRCMCDIKLKVGSKEIYAHKLILISTIPYFRSMFTHNVIEREQDFVTLKDLDSAAVETIIDFAYTASICVTQENVQTLLRVATILQMNTVQRSCCEFLESQLDPTNALGIYSFAELHGCTSLKTSARNYCDRHFTKVTKQEEYFLLPIDRVAWFLCHNELCVRSEIEVLI